MASNRLMPMTTANNLAKAAGGGSPTEWPVSARSYPTLEVLKIDIGIGSPLVCQVLLDLIHERRRAPCGVH